MKSRIIISTIIKFMKERKIPYTFHQKHNRTMHSTPSSNLSPGLIKGVRPFNADEYTFCKPRFRALLLVAILLTSLAGIHIIKASTIKADPLQEGIADEIIRFHVIANSDSTSDQALKLKVKEALVENMSDYLSNANNIHEAREIINKELVALQTVAEELIVSNGYDYPIAVSLEPCYFPIKVYGNYTFPAGIYEALRVQIGEAKGQNWWCVMFPPLCFVDETYSIVDEETNSKLQYLLTEEEYETLLSKKAPVKVKFKIWEYVKKLFR